MAKDTCTRCGTANDDGAKFCEGCGASMAPQISCPTCNAMNPLGRAFCTRCGSSLEHAGWGEAAPPGAVPGAVIDGTWERGGDELIRRVDPEEARRFLGTRTVLVPPGSVGVVLLKGVVDRVLAPGERTSVSMFERLATFFTGYERTAFYLVDQRPFPVPYVVRTKPTAGGEVVKTQVLVTFSLPKGDRAALGRFISLVVGERSSVSASDLYNLLRPEVVRTAQQVLEREPSAVDAEAEIRRQLEVRLAARHGLTLDVTLAPLTTVASVDLVLDGLFTRDAQRVALDLVVRAQGQHEDFTAAKIAPVARAAVAAQLRAVDFAQLSLRAVEAALVAPLAEVLTTLGMTLLAVAAIDVRSATGQWVLGARADLVQRAEEVRVGLLRVAQRDSELDLEALAAVRALRESQLRRDHRFAEADAEIADRERRAVIAERDAVLELGAASRAAVLLKTRKLAELELAAMAEQAQLDKLRAMAQLDREIADHEQAHVLARRAGLAGLTPEQMLAMQAAELDPKWAAALTGERRHTDDLRAIYTDAMNAMAKVAAPPLVSVKKGSDPT